MKTRIWLGVLAMWLVGVPTLRADDRAAGVRKIPDDAIVVHADNPTAGVAKIPADAIVVYAEGVDQPTSTRDEPDLVRYWASVDFLLWRVKDGPVRTPLVVTGPENVLFSGALDIPGTRVLFGGSDLDFGIIPGLRVGGGIWLDDDAAIGVEASAFILEEESTSFAAGGNGAGRPFLARPFINARTGAQNVYFVSQNFANPAISARLTGRVYVTASTQLSGAEANGVGGLVRDDSLQVDGIVGVRGLLLEEELSTRARIRNVVPGGGVNFLGTNVDPSQSVGVADIFRTRNRFLGGQVGGRAGKEWDCFRVGVSAKVALGVMCQEVDIVGSTARIDAAGRVLAAVPAGVFALPTNMGEHRRNRFAVVSEAGADFAVRICPELWARVGYTCLHASSVVRPGDQVDGVVNPNRVPSDATFGQGGNPARPAFRFVDDDFWAHGLNIGLELRF